MANTCRLIALLWVLVLHILLVCASGEKNEPIVTTAQGQLQGSVKELYDGSPYFSFKGVPYARPPVGHLRFRDPLPPQPWQGVLNATEHGALCPQYDEYYEGSEDCLFLNVYTKNLAPSSKVPVMVFIQGGAFILGAGNDDFYGPKFFLQHDVVLVTLNYRLEILGFLQLDTPEVPGNAGMKDQVAALKWVKKNIAQFGGDPDHITLFGESAGAASVTYHLMSPMSQGLFHKAIVQSGTSINDWAQGRDGKTRALRVGKVLGKDAKDTTELLEFLRTVPADKFPNLTEKTLSSDETYRGRHIHFAPVVEKKFENVEAFLTEDPLDALLSLKVPSVPLMIGYNSAEGMSFIVDRLIKFDIFNKNPSFDVPREIADKVTQKKVIEMGEQIRKLYVGDREFQKDDFEQMSALLSDLYFVYNTHRFAHLYSKYNNPIYLYRFSFETDLNYFKKLTRLHVKGSCLADDLFYMFSTNLTQDAYESQDKLKDYVWTVTKLWTDFAKTSDPTPSKYQEVKWPRYTAKDKNFLDINVNLTPGEFPERQRVEFWNKLYCEVGLPCIS